MDFQPTIVCVCLPLEHVLCVDHKIHNYRWDYLIKSHHSHIYFCANFSGIQNVCVCVLRHRHRSMFLFNALLLFHDILWVACAGGLLPRALKHNTDSYVHMFGSSWNIADKSKSMRFPHLKCPVLVLMRMFRLLLWLSFRRITNQKLLFPVSSVSNPLVFNKINFYFSLGNSRKRLKLNKFIYIDSFDHGATLQCQKVGEFRIEFAQWQLNIYQICHQWWPPSMLYITFNI